MGFFIISSWGINVFKGDIDDTIINFCKLLRLNGLSNAVVVRNLQKMIDGVMTAMNVILQKENGITNTDLLLAETVNTCFSDIILRMNASTENKIQFYKSEPILSKGKVENGPEFIQGVEPKELLPYEFNVHISTDEILRITEELEISLGFREYL